MTNPVAELLEVLLLFEDLAPDVPGAGAEPRAHAETVVSNVQAMFPGHEAEVAATALRIGLWDGPSWLGHS